MRELEAAAARHGTNIRGVKGALLDEPYYATSLISSSLPVVCLLDLERRFIWGALTLAFYGS